MLFHPFWFETKERVKEIIRIAPEEGAGQPDNPVCARSQGPERIALGGIAG